MGLVKRLAENNKIISIVGMAKNAGKTATLNFLIEEAIDEGIRLGITSTGRDGETIDIATGTDKPKVYLEEDTLVSIPKELYDMADAGIEILKVTEYHTTLGEVMICKVVDAGYVQVAGPVSTNEQKKLCEDFLNYGVDLVIVDGAIDRRHVANPEVSDGVILATGAVVSRDIKKVCKETAHLVELYNIEKLADKNVEKCIYENIDKGEIFTIGEDKIIDILDIKTGLGASSYIDKYIHENVEYVYLSGAFTSSVIADINMKKLKNVTFVVKDPTKIFIDMESWKKYVKKGLTVKAMNNINLLAITVNPFSPNGYCFDSDILKSEMKNLIKDIPIINVRSGE